MSITSCLLFYCSKRHYRYLWQRLESSYSLFSFVSLFFKHYLSGSGKIRMHLSAPNPAMTATMLMAAGFHIPIATSSTHYPLILKHYCSKSCEPIYSLILFFIESVIASNASNNVPKALSLTSFSSFWHAPPMLKSLD